MEPSSTACAALRSELLKTRDERQTMLERAFARARAKDALAVGSVSLNIPGPDKHLAGTHDLYRHAVREIGTALSATIEAETRDALGPFALLLVENCSTVDVKNIAMRWEESASWNRLVDIDVYEPNGRQIDRVFMGCKPRRCLACDQSARECIRIGRHASQEIIERVSEALRAFTHRRTV